MEHKKFKNTSYICKSGKDGQKKKITQIHKIKSSSDKLSEDQRAEKKYTECWVDLNSEIRECFPEEMTLEHELERSQGKRLVCVSERRRVPS